MLSFRQLHKYLLSASCTKCWSSGDQATISYLETGEVGHSEPRTGGGTVWGPQLTLWDPPRVLTQGCLCRHCPQN